MRGTIDHKRVAAINELVTGWMVPVFKRTDPFNGRVLNGLGPDDFQRVQAGYGCPDCLAVFKTYLAVCPACGFTRNVADDVEAPPADWVAHLEDRRNGTGPANPLASFDEFMAEVNADRDIEHRRL